MRRLAVPEGRIVVRLAQEFASILVARHDGALRVVVAEGRLHHEVLRRGGLLGDEPYVAEDSGEAPEVLVLEERSVAVLEHLDLECVRAALQERGEVELGRQAAILGVAHVLPVQANVHCGRHAAEVYDDAAPLPRVGNRERTGVQAHGVAEAPAREVLRRLCHRVAFLVPGDGIGDVDVERRIEVALQLPAAGHLDLGGLLPLRVDIVLPLEVPRAVEQLQPLRLRARKLSLRDLQRLLGALARNGNRARRQAVDGVDAGIGPRSLLLGLGERQNGCCSHEKCSLWIHDACPLILFVFRLLYQRNAPASTTFYDCASNGLVGCAAHQPI